TRWKFGTIVISEREMGIISFKKKNNKGVTPTVFPYKRVKVGMVSTAIASLFILASGPVAQASSYLRSNSGGELGFEFEKDGGQGSRFHDNLGPLNHGDSLGFEFEKDGGQGSRFHDKLDLPLGGGKYPSAILWSSKSV
ncbi:hypothetical protein RDI91_10275, partial [Streptococcus ruminantium]